MLNPADGLDPPITPSPASRKVRISGSNVSAWYTSNLDTAASSWDVRRIGLKCFFGFFFVLFVLLVW